MTALVGASGAGKSTVFHLLTGLAEPGAGRILIGGADAADMTLPDQRRLFAAVSQETGLFDETLRENLTLGRDGIADSQLNRAIADANVAEFLSRLPAGLDTQAGPRGSALSGGQRQRIAIARAGQILGHVADALHNQSLKATEVQARTVFPSRLVGDKGELAEECADVSLVLKDLCHVAHVDLPAEETFKWRRFTKKQFRVAPSGTIYAVKTHIKD